MNKKLYKRRILEAYKMFSDPTDDDPLDKFSYCIEECMPPVENMDRLVKLIEELNRKSEEDDDIGQIIRTKEVKILLDPFLGSGTTAVACKELGRNFIGIEKEKKYCDIAQRRLDHTTISLF